MFLRILLFLLLALSSAAVAERRNDIPDPALLPEPDSFSIAVVSFRPENEAIKSLLEVALNSITSGEAKLPESMQDVTNYLSRNNRADLLFEGLPFQAVRVDKMNGSAALPAYAVTLAGWRGLQVQVFNSLSAGPEGKAFPVEAYGRTDLVKRDNGVLCRLNGTFLFSDLEARVKQAVDRLSAKSPEPANGALLEAYKALPRTSDAYGVALNKNGEFSALLKSLDNEHVRKVREKVGSERLEKAVANTRKAVWKVDVVSGDRAEFEGVLTLDPSQVSEVASMLEEGRANLDTAKIVDVAITPGKDTVTVKAAVVGLKDLLLDGLKKTAS